MTANKLKVGILSLGCPRNLVDSEHMLGRLLKKGCRIVDMAQAEIGIVNTCAFVKSARDEALAVIKEMAQWKKKGKCQKLYVAGCLPELQRKQIAEHRTQKAGNRDVQSQVSILSRLALSLRGSRAAARKPRTFAGRFACKRRAEIGSSTRTITSRKNSD